MNLYTRLSTLSTFLRVDSSVYILRKKNDCFVKYVEYRNLLSKTKGLYAGNVTGRSENRLLPVFEKFLSAPVTYDPYRRIVIVV